VYKACQTKASVLRYWPGLYLLSLRWGTLGGERTDKAPVAPWEWRKNGKVKNLTPLAR
jgi:hypothetical protein